MPCSDGDYGREEDRIRRQQAERAACEMRNALRGREMELTIETRDWIKKHDREDAQRVELERKRTEASHIRYTALSKLSDAERKELGL